MLRGLQGNECITYLSAFLKCLRSTVVKKKKLKIVQKAAAYHHIIWYKRITLSFQAV